MRGSTVLSFGRQLLHRLLSELSKILKTVDQHSKTFAIDRKSGVLKQKTTKINNKNIVGVIFVIIDT